MELRATKGPANPSSLGTVVQPVNCQTEEQMMDISYYIYLQIKTNWIEPHLAW